MMRGVEVDSAGLGWIGAGTGEREDSISDSRDARAPWLLGFSKLSRADGRIFLCDSLGICGWGETGDVELFYLRFRGSPGPFYILCSLIYFGIMVEKNRIFHAVCLYKKKGYFHNMCVY